MQYPFSERMKKVKRVIIHSDINNCYASIERQLNPSLAGKPIAVCGAAEERHGIVLAKSYEAKAFGVQTGEAIWQAKNKCHNLIIVSPHYDKYVQYSRLAHEIYKKYTPLIEPYGLDECWLDVSGSVELFGSGEEIAAEIHRRFKEELGLTVSCGVASNKIFAKLGSDMKKPDATTVIPEEGFQELVWPLPVSDLWGVGRQTTKKLDSYCINTIGALAKTNLQFLQERFGVAGTQLWLYANGRDTSRVARYGYIAPIKSIGHTPYSRMAENRIRQESNLQKSKRASVEKKIKTAQHALERFEGEILKCLDGTSNFTEDMIAKQIRRYQQELDDAKAEYAALQNARLNEAAEIRKLRTYYDEFRGWAEEFDAAPLEIKRMILSQLIERVEVGRKYQVTIKLNMEYQQFLEITEEQKLIPLISA